MNSLRALPRRAAAAALTFSLICFPVLCGTSRAAHAETVNDLPAEFDLSTQIKSPAGRGDALIRFNQTAGHGGYLLKVLPTEVSLSREAGAGSRRIAESTALGLEAARAEPLKLDIQRRSGRIFVLANARLIMSVEDDSFHDGSAVSSAAGGAACTDLRVQPVEPLYFSDDFMRQPTEPGEWNYDKGSWRIQTVGIVQRGANPFSLEAQPEGPALASTGYSFWSNYHFEAAAKGTPGTTFGICADLQNPQDYYLLRWTSGPSGALELDRVVGGARTALATRKGGFVPGLWYQLGLRTTGGRLVAEVDHQPVLSVQDSRFGAGKIGLYADGQDQKTVWFDSVLVKPAHLLFDDFTPGLHHWDVEGEQAVGGSPDWKNYTTSAQIVGSTGTSGLPFHYQASNRYYLFAWGPTTSELAAVDHGQRKVLASAAHGVSPGSTHNVEAGYEDGYLWGAVDGHKIVEAVDTSIPTGRAGFQPAAAAGHGFRSVDVQLTDPPEPTDALTAEFQNVQHHEEMQAWAGPLNAWEPASFGDDAGYWHKGSLFGDLQVEIPLIPKDLQDGRFAVLLNGDGSSADSGYRLEYTARGKEGLDLALYREGAKVESGHIPAPPPDADTVNLDVYRHGSYVYAGSGSHLALVYHDPAPVDGYNLLQPVGYGSDRGGKSRLGLIVRGATPLDIPDIVVNSRHVYAETFHLAPINWRPQSGEWDVTRRWSCQPGWTWYGGHGAGYAVNWHKAPLFGDQSIDYYAGAMMSATDDSGREAWRDFNCAFCSDGVNLFSGYTLVVAGWDSGMTRLYRKGKQVAESDGFHFPPSGVAHRLWFDTSIAKDGGRIRIAISYVDENGQQQSYPLIDWTDREPLSGGFVGFWTYDNGMMLARAVLSYQQKGPEPLYAATPVWLAQEPQGAPYPRYPEAGQAAAELIKPDPSILRPDVVPAAIPEVTGRQITKRPVRRSGFQRHTG